MPFDPIPRIIDDHGRERRHGSPDPSYGRLIGGSDMAADELRRVQAIEADEKLDQAHAILAAHAEGKSYISVRLPYGTAGLPVNARTVDAARTLIEARRVADEIGVAA